jgi:hypothetical protein
LKKKLLKNEILEKDYAKYVENRLKKKVFLGKKKKVDELLKITEKINKIISQKDKENLFSDGIYMGSFWTICKRDNNCKKAPHKKLLENEVLIMRNT